MDYIYVARKPVWFIDDVTGANRQYEIGEIIPNDVINLPTIGRLIFSNHVAKINPRTIPAV